MVAVGLMWVVAAASLLLAYLSPHWLIDDLWGYFTDLLASTTTSNTKGKCSFGLPSRFP